MCAYEDKLKGTRLHWLHHEDDKSIFSVLHTGAGSGFVRADYLPYWLQNNTQLDEYDVNLRNTSGILIPVVCSIMLSENVETSVEEVLSLVIGNIFTSIVLGTDHFDQHVEEVTPRMRVVR